MGKRKIKTKGKRADVWLRRGFFFAGILYPVPVVESYCNGDFAVDGRNLKREEDGGGETLNPSQLVDAPSTDSPNSETA